MFEKTRPLYPNQIPVGAFKCSKGNVLSQDYLDFVKGNYLTVASFFVDDSVARFCSSLQKQLLISCFSDGQATILISFGSMVKTLPKSVIQTFLKVFEAFPQYRFIWR